MTVYFGKIKFYNLKNPTEELNPEDLVSFELKESKRGLEAFNIKKIIN